eukprot:TRINITY_DN14543_c0_g1_i2.p1 TRINITY_DN14543_c0_g1~~TRINITY_DN14543_c0_g1_i2.p1  ORF type:complete len:599 (+),score=131.41 TRINITY_DN14543_c0_g1_i2:79-1797(+)
MRAMRALSAALLATALPALPGCGGDESTQGSGKEWVWELVEPGNLLDAKGPAVAERPSVRYGTDAVPIPGGFALTHGYLFDHRNGKATWLNDTWRFEFGSARWRRIEAVNQGPSPRYKHATFSWEGGLYVLGGDDGGRGRSHTHIWGAHYSDAWRLDLSTRRWELLQQHGEKPGARQGHTALVWQDYAIVFGGMTSTQESTQDSRYLSDVSDLWLWGLKDHRWSEVRPQALAAGSSAAWPAGRRVHVAAILGNRMVVHGGFSRHIPEKNWNDTWLLDLDALGRGIEQGWNNVHTLWLPGADPESPVPARRGAHVGVGDEELGVMWIFGGANCKLGCTCLSDVWEYRVATRRWREVRPTRGLAPVRRHFHAAALDPRRHYMYVTAGESYGPYGYWNDVWRWSLLGAKPREAYVNRALVYDGIKVHSVMGSARIRDDELMRLRPPAAKEHDALYRSGLKWDDPIEGEHLSFEDEASWHRPEKRANRLRGSAEHRQLEEIEHEGVHDPALSTGAVGRGNALLGMGAVLALAAALVRRARRRRPASPTASPGGCGSPAAAGRPHRLGGGWAAARGT